MVKHVNSEAIVEPLNEAAKSEREEIRIQAEITVMRFKEMQLESLQTKRN